jgi:uncharacterized protein YecE (DUF72 family)
VSVHIGTSGWSYDHWTDVLYPAGTPARDRLSIYVREFDTVELNASFYRWPAGTTFASWRSRLPDQFQMSVKAPRALTHAKRLYQPESWVARIGAGMHELADRRGIWLVQLGPGQVRDDERLDYFLSALPRWLRVAVEFRHASWHVEPVRDILRRHHAAYCVISGAALPCDLVATTDFVYVRLHGPDPTQLYAGSYTDQDLRWWAQRIGEWQGSGRAVYAYFNNDGEGNAVRNARRLRELTAAL